MFGILSQRGLANGNGFRCRVYFGFHSGVHRDLFHRWDERCLR